jgi:hypothetical protein
MHGTASFLIFHGCTKGFSTQLVILLTHPNRDWASSWRDCPTILSQIHTTEHGPSQVQLTSQETSCLQSHRFLDKALWLNGSHTAMPVIPPSLLLPQQDQLEPSWCSVHCLVQFILSMINEYPKPFAMSWQKQKW